MIADKLTDAAGKTRAGEVGETQWGPGVEHTAPGGRLCTDEVIHAYRDPLLAMFMDPVHGEYTKQPGWLLWRCDVDVCDDDGTKLGCTRVRTEEQIAPPQLTTNQRVRAAILLALEVASEPDFAHWARAWLDGSDRTHDAAKAAAAAYAYAAAYAAVARAAAAYAAARAARAAAYADAAAHARAAAVAAAAADYAVRANKKLDILAALHRAIAEEPGEGQP